MEYSGVPPVSGNHWSTYADISKTVYLVEERPELGQLVHAQEHGWTIVWYDEEIARDDTSMARLSSIAAAIAAADTVKVVFMPWTSDDGKAFPAGTHVAMSHWGNTDDGVEHRQFCASPSVDAVIAFSKRNPYTDSREPDAP